MIVGKQETVVYYSLEDLERYELDILATCVRLALNNPTLVVDSHKHFTASEMLREMEKVLNAK